MSTINTVTQRSSEGVQKETKPSQPFQLGTPKTTTDAATQRGAKGPNGIGDRMMQQPAGAIATRVNGANTLFGTVNRRHGHLFDTTGAQNGASETIRYFVGDNRVGTVLVGGQHGKITSIKSLVTPDLKIVADDAPAVFHLEHHGVPQPFLGTTAEDARAVALLSQLATTPSNAWRRLD